MKFVLEQMRLIDKQLPYLNSSSGSLPRPLIPVGCKTLAPVFLWGVWIRPDVATPAAGEEVSIKSSDIKNWSGDVRLFILQPNPTLEFPILILTTASDGSR